MNSKPENASRWLGAKIAEAKGTYISASVFTILSAGCFVLYCWYLSEFAALWLSNGEVFFKNYFTLQLFSQADIFLLIMYHN